MLGVQRHRAVVGEVAEFDDSPALADEAQGLLERRRQAHDFHDHVSAEAPGHGPDGRDAVLDLGQFLEREHLVEPESLRHVDAHRDAVDADDGHGSHRSRRRTGHDADGAEALHHNRLPEPDPLTRPRHARREGALQRARAAGDRVGEGRHLQGHVRRQLEEPRLGKEVQLVAVGSANERRVSTAQRDAVDIHLLAQVLSLRNKAAVVAGAARQRGAHSDGIAWLEHLAVDVARGKIGAPALQDPRELVPHHQGHGDREMRAVHVGISPANPAVGGPQDRAVTRRRRLREALDTELSRGRQHRRSDHPSAGPGRPRTRR